MRVGERHWSVCAVGVFFPEKQNCELLHFKDSVAKRKDVCAEIMIYVVC